MHVLRISRFFQRFFLNSVGILTKKIKQLLNFSIFSTYNFSGFAGISIKEFEYEFHELWSNPMDEVAAAKVLADEEASIERDNMDFENGKSSYSEKLNELSALPSDEFESEKLGALEIPEYAKGLIETPEEERIMSVEDQAYLDSIYEDLDRQSIPSSYDARSKCKSDHKLYCCCPLCKDIHNYYQCRYYLSIYLSPHHQTQKSDVMWIMFSFCRYCNS